MAYDEDLAERIRELVADRSDVTEKRMFGGLAFLVGGRLAVGASGQGGLMVRVAPDQTAKLLTTTKGTPMVMQGREMDGWLRVASEHVRTKRQLQPWVRRGVDAALAAPPEKAAKTMKATPR
jgi:TfoX/Sxy family transcriptional regulator of competence genes